jgi:hypothetical protein
MAAALVGCGGFTELDFTFRSAPADNDAIVTFQQITLHEGMAVGVIARPLDHGDEMDPDTEVVLEPNNPGVLGISPGELTSAEDSRDDPEGWIFVIYGAGVGKTDVAVRIDGDLEAHIPATVLPQ